MKLWLVRHAQPLVRPGVCYGATDIPADAGATDQQARRLAQVLPQGVCVFSSPLQRCESLALALCRVRPDLAHETDARLRELDFGSWEGRQWRDIGREELDHWTEDFAGHRVGGGECVQALIRRVALALEETRRRVDQPGQATPGNAVWITHAGVIRAVTLLAAGRTHAGSASQWPSAAPGYGEWWQLDCPDTVQALAEPAPGCAYRRIR